MKYVRTLTAAAMIFVSVIGAAGIAVAAVNQPANLKAELQVQNNVPGVQLTWDSGNGDEQYFEIEASTEDGHVYKSTVPSSTLSVFGPLELPDTKHTVKVTALDENKQNGVSSDSVSFVSYSAIDASVGPKAFASGQESIRVIVNPLNNPSSTQYAIKILSGECNNLTGKEYYFIKDQNANYVSGSLHPVTGWNTYDALGGANGIELPLSIQNEVNIDKPFCISYASRNQEGMVNPGWSKEVTAYTGTMKPDNVIFDNIKKSHAGIQVLPPGYDSNAEFLVHNITTNKYLSANGSWDDKPEHAWLPFNVVVGNNVYVTANGLTPNTTYQIEAKARNVDKIETDYSIVNSFTTQVSSPATPESIQLQNNGVNADWVGVIWDVNNPGTEDRQVLEYSTDGVTYVTAESNWIQGVNSYRFTSLTPNTSYWFRVAEADDATVSAYATLGPVNTLAYYKNIPFTIDSVFDTSVKITSITNVLGNNPENTPVKVYVTDGYDTYYLNKQGKLVSQETWITYADIGSGQDYTVTGLQPNTQYGLNIEVKNNEGINGRTQTGGQISAVYFTTKAAIPGQPSISKIGLTGFAVLVDPANNPNGITNFLVHDAINDTYLSAKGTWDVVVPGNEPWLIYQQLGADSGIRTNGLQPNTQYRIEVKARNLNNEETAYGPSADVMTMADFPVAPSSVTVDEAGTSTAHIVWQKGVNTGTETNYVISMSYDGITNDIATVSNNTFDYTVTGLVPGSTVHFTVFAYDLFAFGGNNQYSPGVSADALMHVVAPNAPMVVGFTKESVKLNFVDDDNVSTTLYNLYDVTNQMYVDRNGNLSANPDNLLKANLNQPIGIGPYKPNQGAQFQLIAIENNYLGTVRGEVSDVAYAVLHI